MSDSVVTLSGLTSTVILGMLLTFLSLSVCSVPMGVVTPTYKDAMQIQSGARWEVWGVPYGKHSVSGGCCYYCSLVF